MYSSNTKPLSFAPAGGFPKQRIANFGNEIDPVKYAYAPVSQQPTQEMEFSSVVDRAKDHLAFGESRVNRRRISIGERIAELQKNGVVVPDPGLGSVPGRVIHPRFFKQARRTMFPFMRRG